jgi:citrate lyase beta subunit
MIIVSNHLLRHKEIEVADYLVVRLNLAWVKNKEEAYRILDSIEQDIYLDYPQGRSKPPAPTITLDEALELAKHGNVKYFGVSNVEDPFEIAKIVKQLPENVGIIPKIETVKGIRNMRDIQTYSHARYMMLDKEDLYIDAGMRNDVFELLVEAARNIASENNINLLELQGVVFSDE